MHVEIILNVQPGYGARKETDSDDESAIGPLTDCLSDRSIGDGIGQRFDVSNPGNCMTRGAKSRIA
jgi:hypothetical protein